MNLPQPNIPLLRKCVEWAEAEAAKPADQCLWRQKLWAQETVCGTAYCIAGYAVTCSVPKAQALRGDGGGDTSMRLTVGGKEGLWDDVGRQVLGLTVDEANDLFSHLNGIAEVRRIAEAIAVRAGDRL